VEVPIASGSNLTVQRLASPFSDGSDGAAIELFLYDANDRVVARLETAADSASMPIPGDAAPGAFIVLSRGDAVVRLATDAKVEATLREIAFEVEYRASRPAIAGSPVEWTEEIDALPVRVGLYRTYEGAYAEATPSQLRIESPTGVLLELEYGCNIIDVQVCWAVPSEGQNTIWAPQGHEALTMGTYSFEFTRGASHPGEVGTAVLWFAR
jgi:hypothetical protein